LSSEINRSWNKSKNGWEFGPKAVRFMKVMLNIIYVEGKNLHMLFDTILDMIPGPPHDPGVPFQKN
jgi:hypothetical protein